MEEHHSDRLKLEEDRLLKLHSSLCKVMSNPRRIRMIHLLEEGEKNVGELVEATGLLKAAVSQNLGMMKRLNLVQSRREGQKIYYSLKARKVLTACNAMEGLLLELLEEESDGA